MKKGIAVFFLLLASAAHAQQVSPAQEQIERTIGNLFVTNTTLQAQIAELKKQLEDAKKQLEEAKKAPAK